MTILNVLHDFGLSFVSQLKERFLSENSRLWWGWIFITFPLFGALLAAREMKRQKQNISLKGVVRFVFPPEIYKSSSFRNDVIFVFMLYVIYAAFLLFLSGFESKKIVGQMVVFFNSGFFDQAHLSSYKDIIPANLGTHLLFTFLVILVYDLGFTLIHYAFHKVPFLWRFHKIHHSAEHLTPLTVARFHLVEYITFKAVEGLSIGLVFGVFYYFHPQNLDIIKVLGLSLFGILFSSIGVFRHSHIWISYGIFDYIFCSPAMHQIHHSKEARHIDKNMSQIFSFWDYLLGTLYVPKGRETFAVGLSDENDWNDRQSTKNVWAAHFKA